MRFVGESGKIWKSRPESLTNFMKLSPEKIVVVEFSQTELLNVDRFSWKKIFISFSQVLHPSVRFWKTPKNRKVSTRMNRFESLGSTLNAYRVTTRNLQTTFTGMILIPNPKESFKLVSLCGHKKSFFHLLEHIRHISWFLYIPFCLATLTVASKASSLLISWNAWWSASWFPQRALHKTAASLQSRICSLTWNRKIDGLFENCADFDETKLSKANYLLL